MKNNKVFKLLTVMLLVVVFSALSCYCDENSLVVTEDGNVGIGVEEPVENFNVNDLFKVDGENGVVQTSRYVKEFSGKIYGPGNWPDCTDPAKIVKIGNMRNSPYNTFVEINLYGSHRGYNNTNAYFDYKKWVILVGDRISSNLVASAGAGNKVNLYDGQNEGNYNNNSVNNDFDIMLKVNPQCGAGMRYTYVVRYYSDANFTPDPNRVW